MNPWLLVLSFVLGVVLTWFWAVRTVRREIPAEVLRRVWGDKQRQRQAAAAARE